MAINKEAPEGYHTKIKEDHFIDVSQKLAHEKNPDFVVGIGQMQATPLTRYSLKDAEENLSAYTRETFMAEKVAPSSSQGPAVPKPKKSGLPGLLSSFGIFGEKQPETKEKPDQTPTPPAHRPGPRS